MKIDRFIFIDKGKKMIPSTQKSKQVRAKRPVVAKNAVSLFSGAGGDSIGLKQAGYQVVAFSEFKKPAIATHLKEFPSCKLLTCPETSSNDITQIPDSVFEQYATTTDIVFAGFPCFIKDTLVQTSTGYKPIQDVSLEDSLLTHTGQFQSIVNLQRKDYTGKLYDIKLKYHPEIITCTEEHPFYVRTQQKIWNNSLRKYEYSFADAEWKKASELTLNDYFGMVINTQADIPSFTFDKKVNKYKYQKVSIVLDQPDYWFMMGYFIGDGWIEETKKNGTNRFSNKIRFAFNTQDTDIIRRIQNVLPITNKMCSSGNCDKYGCSDFMWFNILKQFGKYAHSKLIPEWVQSAPKHFVQEFINGYMAADGCILKSKSHRITTVSYNLAYGLQRLYLKLGSIASVTKTARPKTCVIQGRTCNQRDTYEVYYYPSQNKSTSFISENYVWFKPFTITSKWAENEPVFNFEVDIDNSYIVCNTIVHNCQGFSHAGKKKSDDPRNELVNEFARVTRITRPKYIIGENVAGLLSRKGKDPKTQKMRPVIDIIRDLFTSIGYNITYKVLKASDFGVPQERKRLIIVGTPDTLGYPHMPWDSLTAPTLPQFNTIRSFLETHLDGAVEFPKENIPDDLSPHYWIETSATKAEGKAHPNLLRLNGGIRNKSSKEKKESGDDKPLTIEGGLISFGVRKSAYHGQILDPDATSKTIICTYGTCPRLFVGLYNPKEDKYWVRCLSVKELGQIQGFPASYQWQGNEKEIITQIGNAVPPALCESVVRSLPNIIFKQEPQISVTAEDEKADDEEDEADE